MHLLLLKGSKDFSNHSKKLRFLLLFAIGINSVLLQEEPEKIDVGNISDLLGAVAIRCQLQADLC